MALTDPNVIAAAVQTAVLTFTLVIFIIQFRSQERTNREAAYETVLADYTDGIRMLVDNPELRKLTSELTRTITGESTQSDHDAVVRNYFVYMYGVMERIYILYRRRWIDKDTWDQWSAFLERISKHPTFKSVHNASEGMYDKEFLDYISVIMEK